MQTKEDEHLANTLSVAAMQLLDYTGKQWEQCSIVSIMTQRLPEVKTIKNCWISASEGPRSWTVVYCKSCLHSTNKTYLSVKV